MNRHRALLEQSAFRPTLEMLSYRALSVEILLALVTDSQHDH